MIHGASSQTERILALGHIERAAELLKALGHPHRLMIVCALMNGERAVSWLERELAIRQPSLSQHLGSLRDAGIIASRRHAKSVIYKISDVRIAPIIDVLRAGFDGVPQKDSGLREKELKGPIAEMAVRSGAVVNTRAPGEAAFFARVGRREHA